MHAYNKVGPIDFLASYVCLQPWKEKKYDVSIECCSFLNFEENIQFDFWFKFFFFFVAIPKNIP
jgi:hypothetical protein